MGSHKSTHTKTGFANVWCHSYMVKCPSIMWLLLLVLEGHCLHHHDFTLNDVFQPLLTEPWLSRPERHTEHMWQRLTNCFQQYISSKLTFLSFFAEAFPIWFDLKVHKKCYMYIKIKMCIFQTKHEMRMETQMTV